MKRGGLMCGRRHALWSYHARVVEDGRDGGGDGDEVKKVALEVSVPSLMPTAGRISRRHRPVALSTP